ncbi:rRNA biogenesis protein rrp5 [Malassezia caprae]|uniref:rRNA biogenesis protein rrp5 n=1 Tax=Malassezia caprae TaxID=1381934 RepID=A0AAF0E479_9BASI|nr:rRNA biogenesis protein rrp5 [Malassezia caprae]
MKRSRTTEESQPKRAASSSTQTSTKKAKKDVPVAPNIAARPSSVAAFPRGGGTGLTPLEYRQSVLEGRKESISDDLFQEAPKSKRTKPTFKARAKSKKAAETPTPSDRQRVELLNYKRLLPGTKMLCSVLAVHPLAIVVSMCDQLLGHVPVTSVSRQLTERLQAALDDEDEASEDMDDEEDAPPELHEIFTVGQWVRASVESVGAPGTQRQWGLGREGGEYERESQRVQLTLEPHVVNEGISASDLSEGYMLSATVTSREDHGYALELGLEDDMHGFLPFQYAPQPLRVGQVVLVQVRAVEGRALRVSLAEPGAPSVPSVPPSQSAMLPGVPVKALITTRVPQGLNVKLFGMLDGTIDNFHVPPHLDEAALAPGKKILTRVLWNMPGDLEQVHESGADAVGARRIGLSAAAHVVELQTPLVGAQALTDAYPIGARVQVRVKTVLSGWGLMCDVVGAEVSAFVHISRVADEHIDALAPTQGKYRVGSEHAARVTGHAMTDRLLLLSLQPSVLEKQYMRVSEVPVGEVVRVTIRKVTPQAIFVRLSSNVDGVVFPMHFSDVHLAHPEKKFKPNLSMNARIIHTDPMRNRIVLTLKRSLVQAELPLITSIEDARPGALTLAVVVKHLPASLLVELGGTLRAVVPLAEVSESTLSSTHLAELFPPGKVCKVRLIKVEPEDHRILASIKQASPAYLEKLNVDVVELGEKVQTRVATVRDDVAITLLEPAGTRALLALACIARQRGQDVSEVRASLAEKELLSDLYVVKKNAAKGLVVLSDQPPKGDMARVVAGSEYQGRVVERYAPQLTCTVVLDGTQCRARLHVTECADDLAAAELPAVNDVVHCVALHVRKGGREADISLRPSRMGNGTATDAPVDTTSQLETGQQVRGIVKSITDHGVYVSLGRRIDARVMIKELFDEYVKDFRSRFEVGQCVTGTVLQLDGSGKVELSLKKSRLTPSKPSATQWGDYRVGEKVCGHIRATAEYGVFVQIDGTNISGLCHKSELSDNAKADAVRAYAVGDRVKAVILKLDAEKKRISFGLKPSYFDEEDYEDEEEEEDEEDEEDGDGLIDEDEEDDEDEEEIEHDLIDDEAEEGEDGEDEEDEDENDDDNVVGVDDDDEEVEDDDDEEAEDDNVEEVEDDDDEEVEDDDDDDDDESEVDDDDNVEDDDAPTRSLQQGFRWDAPMDEDEDEESSDEEPVKSSAKKGADDDLADDISTKLDSATDFERVLLGSPNSSFLWIQFMTFYLQTGDVEKARQVARRALKVIHFREEQEKLNVWIALLNLENMYGSPDTLDAVFKEAIQLNDAFEVHMRLLSILENSNKLDEAAALFKRTAKKFGFRPSVWIDWYQFLLRHERAEEAHELVSRSLQSLDKREHIRALTAYALAEFKIGDVEHARTMFETLVSRYPKRLDLWWQYMDQEVRLDNINGVRSLMERVFVARKHSTKQIKALLQKWLVIEKRIGDEDGVQAVLDRARAFVASVQNRTGEESD